jgi:transcriptional repressor NrdR
MRCPFCDAEKESLKVIDSRTAEGGRAIRRRRECLNCNKRFTTYERIEENVRLTVIKRDGRRIPWDRGKIVAGLQRACFKRPVPESEILRIADEVEEETFKAFDREVPSTVIGATVADKLRRVDQVAYVRFASVYRQFKTLEELVEEAKAVIDAKRFEDPTQGRLFIEQQQQQAQAAAAAKAADGGGNHARADVGNSTPGAAAAPPRKRRAARVPEPAMPAAGVPAEGEMR